MNDKSGFKILSELAVVLDNLDVIGHFSGFRVQGSGFRVQGSWLNIQGTEDRRPGTGDRFKLEI